MENKQNIKDLINKFYPHAKEKLGFDHPVRVIMRQDAENAQQSLGKTAYYDPAEKLIVLYITNRHPKDVLRSFSHELVHHAQNCRGELDDLSTDAHYAKDGKGREIEEEAYLQGNLNLRDYEDSIKYEGVNKMKLTKSQLKGLIKSAVKQISEGGMPMKDEPEGEDLNKDGKKGHGKVPAFLEEEPVDEQEALTISPEGSVELPEDVQRVLDMLDAQLASMDDEDKQMIAKLITRLALEKAGVDVASPELDVDEMHCGGNRDDELEEQEVVTPRSEKEKKEEEEKKKGFKKRNPEFSKALDNVKLRDKETAIPSDIKLKESNETWYNSSLYESLKSKWTK